MLFKVDDTSIIPGSEAYILIAKTEKNHHRQFHLGRGPRQKLNGPNLDTLRA